MPDGQLQVLISTSPALVAGLPPAVRAAHLAASDLPDARIVLCGGEALERRFPRQLSAVKARCANGEPAATVLDPEQPLLVLSGDGFPRPAALKDFVARAAAEGRPARWTCGGRTAAAFFPRMSAVVVASEDSASVAARALAEPSAAEGPGWVPVADAAEAATAERALFAALPKDTDGYIAKFDRKLSMAISSVLLKLPVTPNDITTASLVLGLLGAWWLASGSYALTLAGAFLLWFCCLLDGCDGEVARLKLLSSPSGAAYDLWADHVAHLATFVAIPLGVHRAFPAASFKVPGALLVSGFLACMFSVWYLVLRKPEAERGRYALLIERVASRDYVYLIAALAVLGHLDWFLYAAGVGSHVFWAALWLVAA